MPLFEKAGVDNKTILAMMKLNELEGLHDIMQLSEQRQDELFEEMLASNKYIPPRELQEHKGMLNYAYRYLMSSEFRNLEEDQKLLIEQHVREREQLASGGMGTQPSEGPAPGPAPAGPTAQEVLETTQTGMPEAQVGTPAAGEGEI